jgi:hypothetical protein
LGLLLLQGDKSGRFAVIKKVSYEEKKKAAFEKNFVKVGSKTCGIGKAKDEVREILNENGKTDLAGNINSAKGNWLKAFTSVKTHKIKWPLRVIITEANTWLNPLSTFLQFGLSLISLKDEWRIKNTEEAVERMSKIHGRECKIISLDIQDMYFNVDIKIICDQIKKLVVEQGELSFIKATGVSLDDFTKLVKIYFDSTVIRDGSTYYTQRKGACIGSKAAPLASEVFLQLVDGRIRVKLIEMYGEKIILAMRFVDDYWSALDKDVDTKQILEIFREQGMGLEFTMEEEHETDGLQFLETRSYTKNGLCWSCCQRSPKPILPWNSDHAKEIKSAVTENCVKSVVLKACPCKMKESLYKAESRLRKAGYPKDFVHKVKNKVINNWSKVKSSQEKSRNYVGMRRYHKITHAIGKKAKKYDVDVVSKYPEKYRKLVNICNRDQEEESHCPKHKHKAFECGKKNCIYSIKMSCGGQYIGTTSKCANTRLSEHMKGDAKYSSFNTHKTKCKCNVKTEECRILTSKEIKGERARLAIETFLMENEADAMGKQYVFSNPSVKVGEKEREFISKQCKL